MDDLGPLASTETFSESPDDQSCNDTPGCESCSDGIQNQGEQAVDCGGPCMPCACQCTGAVDANGEPLGPVTCGDAVCSLDNAELMCVDFEELKEVGSCQ
jgi:hypothetical protein